MVLSLSTLVAICGIAAFLIQGAGLLIGWGMLKQQLKTLKEDVDWIKGKFNNGVAETLGRLDERVNALEDCDQCRPKNT